MRKIDPLAFLSLDLQAMQQAGLYRHLRVLDGEQRPSAVVDHLVVSDELNHASIIDGCRLSRATIKVFPHRDIDAARRILESLPAPGRKLLITDGVFSMDGDLGSLPQLCVLAEEFGCIMMVDDAHGSGVFGRR